MKKPFKFIELHLEGGRVVARENANWADEINAVWQRHFERMKNDPEYAARCQAEFDSARNPGAR